MYQTMEITESAYRLPKRLAAVAGLVSSCDRLIDIGTDHALLPIEAIRQNLCPRAIAVDIRSGPLAAAERNITAAGLTGKIEICLSDGLARIDLQPNDIVVIAGLGGYEMMDILGLKPRHCSGIILQPMKSAPELRQWLSSNGYRITDEQLVIEDHRTYTVIRCLYTGECCEMNAMQMQIGPILLENKPAGFAFYLERQIRRLEKQLRSDSQLRTVLDELYIMRNQIKEDHGCLKSNFTP
jgi:tRNA (adenine22-N1)-methyltransferase